MANEFIARKGIISLDSIQVSGSITATGGITVSGSISSASFATSAATASSADNFFVRQNLTASSALFTGSITAQTLVVQTVTSSITYSSGSNIFGNLPSNVQQFTGSLRVTGSGNHFIQGGNVGIGNSTPANLLTIDGVSTCAKISIETDTVSANTVIGYLDFTNNNAGTTYGRVLGGRNSAGDGYVALGTGVSNNLYALESGYVGIGTSSPSTALHISSSTTQITLQNNAGGTNARRIGMNMTSGDTFKILSLCDNNTTRVDNIIVANVLSGNVGIGTASPNTALQVNLCSGTAYSSGATGNAITIYNTCAINNQYVGLILQGEPTAGNAGQATIYGITTGGGAMDMAFSTRGSSVLSERMRITSEGIACFACQVCAPQGIFINGATSLQAQFGQNNDATGTQTSAIDIISRNAANTAGFTFRIQNCATTCTTHLVYGGNTVMAFRCDGNVGTGTTTPTNGKLEIQQGATTAALWAQTGGTTSSYVIADFRTGTNLSALQILGNGVSSFGGNVGIGCASPSYVLDVRDGTTGSAGGRGMRLSVCSNSAGPQFRLEYQCSGNSRNWLIGTNQEASGDFIIRSSTVPGCDPGGSCSITRFSISKDGNIGIGTLSTSTEANLFLGAQSTIEGGQLVLQKGTSCSCATHLDNYNDSFRIMSGTNTGSTLVNMIIDHKTGYLGIGTFPSYQLDVQLPSGTNGQIIRLGRSAGAYYWSLGIDSVGSCFNFYNNSNTSVAVISPVTGVYTATSDCRVKSNITDSCTVLDKILQVKVRQYIWNESCEREDYGLIAQEVNEVLPQYVKQGDENTNWGVSKSEFVPALIKAIQEQQCQICTQSIIIDQLKTCLGII